MMFGTSNPQWFTSAAVQLVVEIVVVARKIMTQGAFLAHSLSTKAD